MSLNYTIPGTLSTTFLMKRYAAAPHIESTKVQQTLINFDEVTDNLMHTAIERIPVNIKSEGREKKLLS